MSSYATVNQIYAEFFPSNPPARAAFAVAALPAGALIEIDAIAIIEQVISEKSKGNTNKNEDSRYIRLKT